MGSRLLVCLLNKHRHLQTMGPMAHGRPRLNERLRMRVKRRISLKLRLIQGDWSRHLEHLRH